MEEILSLIDKYQVWEFLQYFFAIIINFIINQGYHQVEEEIL